MSLFTPSLWPERVTRPYARLALGIVLAPAILVLLGAAIAFVIAGASEATAIGTRAVTMDATLSLTAALVVLTVIAVLPGIALLWALAKRGVLAWGLAGLAFGAAASAAMSLGQRGVVEPFFVGVGTALTLLLFLLIRGIAGIRTR
jgi:hypothetical protein